MSENEEMTPKRLRTMASVYRDPEDRHLVRLDTDRTTADILDGLAVLWEREGELVYRYDPEKGRWVWTVLSNGLIPQPTPVAALVALGREARTQEAPDASA
jgi:hypothetical protein